jgi:hypothetical protein
MVNEEYITVREAARELGRGTTRVRQHIRDGRIKSIVAHGIVWVLKEDVLRVPSLMRRYEKQAKPVGAVKPKNRGKNRRRVKVAKTADVVSVETVVKPTLLADSGRSGEP